MKYSQSRFIPRAIVPFGCIITALCLVFTAFFSMPALAAGKAYVTNVYGTNVSVVDIETNSVIKAIPLYSPSTDCSTETPYLHDIEVVGSKVFVSVPGRIHIRVRDKRGPGDVHGNGHGGEQYRYGLGAGEFQGI